MVVVVHVYGICKVSHWLCLHGLQRAVGNRFYSFKYFVHHLKLGIVHCRIAVFFAVFDLCIFV